MHGKTLKLPKNCLASRSTFCLIICVK